MKKRILSILMCMFHTMSFVPVSAGAVEDAEGMVTITKQLVSSVADEDGNYTIKLTVQGNPISSNVNTNADVVLVVDNSGSMASSVGVECGSTTFNYTNTKDFSLGGTGFYWDIYECPDRGARYIRCYSKFLGQEAQTFYDERPNTESGENCTGEMGNIIRINAARDVSKEFAQAILRDENGGATGNKLALIGFSHNDRSGGADDTKAITVSQNLTDNLGTVNGKIDNMTADGGTNYSAALKKAYDILDGRSDKTRPGYVVFISDGAPGYSGQSLNDSSWNGSRQIADLKGAGITVYTIGISLDSAPAEYLKNMASDVKSEHFKNVSGSDYKAQLSSILNTWAGQINTMPAGTDAIMTDVVNEKYFALVTESCAGLAVAEDGKTITWDIGTIPAEMKEITFKIRPKEGVYGESLPTNESCVLRYTKSDKTTDSITAESPKLTINGPMQPDTVDLPVEKVWQNVPEGTELPEKVTVSLYADGSENPVGTIDLDAEGQWRGVFEGVQKYNESGKEISYTVGETPVENYTSACSETATGGWIITNTYNVPTPPDPSPAVVNIRASKTLDGAAPSGEVFSFILKNGDGSTVQTKNNAGGTVVFSPLTFSAEGIYTYTLEEALGTDGSINYDGTVYTITVNVIKDSAGNRYTAEVSYVKDGAPYDGEPAFENTTKTGTVIVGKTVSGGGSSTSQRFTFKATLNSAAEADSAESVFSGKYGDVEFVGGTAEFSLKHGESVTISGLPAGTVYYIEETDSQCR